MREYKATPGLGLQINLSHILDAAKREIMDLPVIPDFVDNGRPVVCWAHVFGRCHFGGNCSFARGHIPWGAIPDRFATVVVDMLQGGVAAVVVSWRQGAQGGGSPVKKQKGEEAE